ncbi:hypothetical protein DESC_340028 [Desulfosarcina cetonica]|nr:hypothetical protein DESC_340028 [Desulfosarcina cetonica]
MTEKVPIREKPRVSINPPREGNSNHAAVPPDPANPAYRPFGRSVADRVPEQAIVPRCRVTTASPSHGGDGKCKNGVVAYTAAGAYVGLSGG